MVRAHQWSGGQVEQIWIPITRAPAPPQFIEAKVYLSIPLALKMPPQVFTEAQQTLLKLKLSTFVELQESKRSMADFWETVMHEYFEANGGPDTDYVPPEKPIKLTKKGKESRRQPKARVRVASVFPTLQAWKDDREKVRFFITRSPRTRLTCKRPQKIKDWFRNATNKAKRARKPAVKIVVSATSQKRARMLSETQVYSTLYYDECIKPELEERMKKESSDRDRLKIANEIASSKLQGETEAVKKEVKEELNRLLKEKAEREEKLAKILEKEQAVEQNPDNIAV